MGTITEKLQKLIATKDAIKNAIIAKGQPVTDADTFASYADKIGAIETGVDTSDADATAADIAYGQTAYVNGEKVTGTVIVAVTPTSGYGPTAHSVSYVRSSDGNNSIEMRYNVPSDMIMREGGKFDLARPVSDFGDAEASNVLFGKTFTSKNGLKIAGSIRTISGTFVENPTLSVNTSVAYPYVRLTGKLASEGLISSNTSCTADAELTNFGDATAADVAAGKTFTSAAGLNVTGTASLGGRPADISIINGSSYNINYFYVDSEGYLVKDNLRYGQPTSFDPRVGDMVLIYKAGAEIEDDGSAGIELFYENLEILVYYVRQENGTIYLRDAI